MCVKKRSNGEIARNYRRLSRQPSVAPDYSETVRLGETRFNNSRSRKRPGFLRLSVQRRRVHAAHVALGRSTSKEQQRGQDDRLAKDITCALCSTPRKRYFDERVNFSLFNNRDDLAARNTTRDTRVRVCMCAAYKRIKGKKGRWRKKTRLAASSGLLYHHTFIHTHAHTHTWVYNVRPRIAYTKYAKPFSMYCNFI